jgi:protein phosphatase
MISSLTQTSWKDCLEVAAKSDIGLRRYNNQDAHAEDLAGSQQAFLDRGHLFLVADGMGAHAAGETASKKAAEVIPLAYRKLRDLPPPEALREAVREANQEIFQCAQANENFRGMGTTVSALAVLPSGAWIAQVGDSRVYRCRGDVIEQLSQDHSLAWELRRLPEDIRPQYVPKNIITRSLGPQMDVEVDLEGPFPVQPGDIFVLCTDGLSGQVSDEEIGQIVRALPPAEAVETLVNLANLRGGPDNITVTVVRVKATAHCASSGDATGDAVFPARSRWIRLAGYLCIAVGIIGFAVALFGVAQLKLLAHPSVWGILILPLVALFFGLYLLSHPAQTDGPVLRLGNPSPPYSTANCAFRRETLENLLQILAELEDAARQENWDIDWSLLEKLRTSAVATRDDRLGEAIADACRAINHVMTRARQQRRQTHPAPNDPFFRQL